MSQGLLTAAGEGLALGIPEVSWGSQRSPRRPNERLSLSQEDFHSLQDGLDSGSSQRSDSRSVP